MLKYVKVLNQNLFICINKLDSKIKRYHNVKNFKHIVSVNLFSNLLSNLYY